MTPWSTPTVPLIGACMLPKSFAMRTSRDGRDASASTSFASMTLPSTKPTFTTRISASASLFFLMNSLMTFAGATASSFEDASAVVPFKCGTRSSSPSSFAAIVVSVFLMT